VADATLPPTPRALLLDFAGTLLREDDFDLSRGLRSFLEGSVIAGRSVPAPELDEWVSELETIALATQMLPDRELCLAEWLRSRFPIAPADVAVAELAIWLGAVELSPMEGASEALERARVRGVRLGILANSVFGGRTLEFELRRRGFDVPFEFVVTSGDLGLRKPYPLAWRAALDRFGAGTEADAVWCVGDSWSEDVAPAADMGLRAVWLGGDRAGDDVTSALCVRTWKDLTEILESAR